MVPGFDLSAFAWVFGVYPNSWTVTAGTSRVLIQQHSNGQQVTGNTVLRFYRVETPEAKLGVPGVDKPLGAQALSGARAVLFPVLLLSVLLPLRRVSVHLHPHGNRPVEETAARRSALPRRQQVTQGEELQ